MTLRALLFDLDDTLYGYAPCNEAALTAAYAILRARAPVSPTEFRETHDVVRAELARELHGQAASHNRALFFKRIVERLVGPGEGSLAIELFDTYWSAFLAEMRPAPDAHEVLAKLKGRYELALVSNHTTDIQLRKLRALDFERFFPVVVTSEEAGVEKPDAHIFELALRALGVNADEALMIGDSPAVDLRGACNAGVPCILSRQFSAPELAGDAPETTIASLSELPDWLRRR